MSRLERVGQLLRQIEHETQTAFDEHTELLNLNNQLKAENAKLRELVLECLSTVCGWAWVLNELTGHDKLEEGTVPTAEFRRLQALARELEVPNA